MVGWVFYDAPEMTAVVACESGFKHYLSNGGVIQGPTHDSGVMQLHAPSWEKKMEEMGMNIDNLYDNLKFGRILYDESGSRPWVCSRKVALK